ncbi:MAG: hypothetical protein K2J83_04770 [Clostridia bacterium]|nr:hypothetical protein [Clostridia bacterium]
MDFFEDAESYNRYFDSIIEKLPKDLVKYYNEQYSGNKPNRFHDCKIRILEFNGNANIYRKEVDAIRIVLSLGEEIEYDLVFSGIVSSKVKYNSSENFYDVKYILGEILHCELGLSKDYILKFYTSTGFEMFLEFQSVKIKKRIFK